MPLTFSKYRFNTLWMAVWGTHGCWGWSVLFCCRVGGVWWVVGFPAPRRASDREQSDKGHVGGRVLLDTPAAFRAACRQLWMQRARVGNCTQREMRKLAIRTSPCLYSACSVARGKLQVVLLIHFEPLENCWKWYKRSWIKAACLLY